MAIVPLYPVSQRQNCDRLLDLDETTRLLVDHTGHNEYKMLEMERLPKTYERVFPHLD